MAAQDFDLRALYEALDEQRRARHLTWKALTGEVNRHRTTLRPISASTITGLKDKPAAEGDGILQMLIWLRRTPESFVPGMPDPHSPHFVQPDLRSGQVLRWNKRALYAALDERRRARPMTWDDLASEISGFTSAMLKDLNKGGRIGFPRVMRLVRYLGEPAAAFTHVANW
jgi:hypothetical protein